MLSRAERGPALVAVRPGVFAVEDVEPEPLAADSVLVRTHLSGISTGTDRWVSLGRFGWQQVNFPCIPGYQRVGVVEAVGTDVHGIVPGDRVAALTSPRVHPPAASWGAHCALATTAERNVFVLDPAICAEQAAFITSAQVGVNAAYRPEVAVGDPVVVYGDGIIGACAALAALSRGCVVTLVGHHDEKLTVLSGLGIATVNNASAASSDTVREASVVIDTVQNVEVQREYQRALAKGSGQIVYSGHSPDGTTVWADMAALQQQALTAHFVSGWTRERLELTLRLMATGRLPVDRLVGWRAGVGDAVRVGELMAAGRLPAIATLIDWKGDTA